MAKYPTYEDAVSALLSSGNEFSVNDVQSRMENVPSTAVNARIRALVQHGRIVRVGKGRYVAVRKPVYRPELSPWVMEVNDYIVESCKGINFCIFEVNGNIEVQTGRSDIPVLISALRIKYSKVVAKSDAVRFPGDLEGYIIVGHMVSDSPLLELDGMRLPSLEKEIVDKLSYCIHRESPFDTFALQKLMETYPVNTNSLRRYASRRGLAEEMSSCLSEINKERLEMFNNVQRYLSGTAVTRAWVFGSFARGEETPTSDLDLLVDYDESARVSLLTIIRYKLDMEKLLGRDVDLVTNGSLRPFAIESANRDKYLIYER